MPQNPKKRQKQLLKRRQKEKARKKKNLQAEQTQLQREKRRIELRQLDLIAEAEHIIECAQKQEMHVVDVGMLVLFSTVAGDAWILDPIDQFALQLAKGGRRMEFGIQDKGKSFAVAWNADHRVEGDAFIVAERESDRVRVVDGVPLKHIREAAERLGLPVNGIDHELPSISSSALSMDSKGTNTAISFECKKCQQEFDCSVGDISLDKNRMRPIFEKDILCPRCGKVSMDDVLLTELGQSQMTEATWNL